MKKTSQFKIALAIAFTFFISQNLIGQDLVDYGLKVKNEKINTKAQELKKKDNLLQNRFSTEQPVVRTNNATIKTAANRTVKANKGKTFKQRNNAKTVPNQFNNVKANSKTSKSITSNTNSKIDKSTLEKIKAKRAETIKARIQNNNNPAWKAKVQELKTKHQTK